MSEPKATKSGAAARQGSVVSTLRGLLGRLFGRDGSELDAGTPLIDLGADSLFLLQASQAIQKEFRVKIPFRLLLEDLSTIEAIAHHVSEQLPAESPEPEPAASAAAAAAPEPPPPVGTVTTWPAPPAPEPVRAAATAPSAEPQEGEPDELLKQIIDRQLQISARQLEIMTQQLELLRGPAAAAGEKRPDSPAGAHDENGFAAPPPPPTAPAPAPPAADAGAEEPEVFVPYQPPKKALTGELDERQRRHLDALVARLNERTAGSKRLTETYRPYLADSRAVAGFRYLWKEMVYPLVIEHAEGARIRDVDGNEYVDLNMGFGALLFGHSPPFIIEAMREQLGGGLQLGPQAHLAGRVAQLICELTGAERAAFCNSGTEAVMTALRLARAVTGRTKVALFEGCYHGTFDGVLVRGDRTAEGGLRAVPMAPGVPPHMVEDVLLLKYNSPEAVEALEACGHELAAVLIEPPRSRRPDVQPKAFLKELSRVTRRAGAALIFDEVVTGFRFHPGGAQAMFDVQADLVTYGKAVGGGLPAAVIAGRAAFMDAVDGGMWNYGDDSYPQADVTYFTGTYFKHPLIMPALWAALSHVKERGLRLQEELDEKTSYVVGAITEHLERARAPIRVGRFGSLFRFLPSASLKYADILYYHLLEKGVYLSETRNCFISTAHTRADLDAVIRAVRESLDEMRAGGFLPESPAGPPPGERPAESGGAAASRREPLTESQKQIWTLAQMGDEGARAYNLSTALRMLGKLDHAALRAAFQRVVDRHEALRATFSPDGDYQEIAARLQADVPLVDFSRSEDREALTADWLAGEARQSFDLSEGPLVKAAVARLSEDEHLLVVTAHHIISDGWSFGTMLGELKEIYSAECRGVPSRLREPRSFGDYARLQAAKQRGEEMAAAEAYWLGRFADGVPVLNLPTDRPRRDVQTFGGAQQRLRMRPELAADLKRLSARQGCTLFMLLLGGFKAVLRHLTGQDDILVGIPSAGQISPDGGYLIGYCVNLLPLRSRLEGAQPFTQYLSALKGTLADAYDYQDYPYGRLLKRVNVPREPGRSPLVEAVFNLDRSGPPPDFHGLAVEVAGNHNHSSKFDLTFDVTEAEDGLLLDCEYNTDLFDAGTARGWMELYEAALTEIAARPDLTLDALGDSLRAVERRREEARRSELKQLELKKIGSARRRAVHGPPLSVKPQPEDHNGGGGR